MIVVHFLYLTQVELGFCFVAHAVIAQGEHVQAVDAVKLVEVALPNQQVGQRYGKVVHHHMVEDVLLAVVNELMEQRAGLIFLTEFAVAQGGIEDLVGLRIVVVHGCCGVPSR